MMQPPTIAPRSARSLSIPALPLVLALLCPTLPGQEPPRAAKTAAKKTEKKTEKKEKSRVAAAISALKLRGIGPAITSGRISDIAVDPKDKSHWIAAVSSGGVWETRNAGTTWKPVFDGQGSYSIGCVTFDPSDPLIVWVGSGENNSQRSVSYGDGVYKSTDGGRSWKNVASRNPSTSATS